VSNCSAIVAHTVPRVLDSRRDLLLVIRTHHTAWIYLAGTTHIYILYASPQPNVPPASLPASALTARSSLLFPTTAPRPEQPHGSDQPTFQSLWGRSFPFKAAVIWSIRVAREETDGRAPGRGGGSIEPTDRKFRLNAMEGWGGAGSGRGIALPGGGECCGCGWGRWWWWGSEGIGWPGV
jgi:hypothetical protein